MNVLFVGNSYTFFNDLPEFFGKLCTANGKEVKTFSVTRGGRRLIQSLEGDEAALELEALLQGTAMDVCFLQEQSTLPIVDYPQFEAGVRGLSEKYRDQIRKFVLYMTWGRKEGAEFLAERGLTNETMTAALADAYKKAADTAGAELSLVGLGFRAAANQDPRLELHDPDKSHPSPLGSCLAALVHYVTLFRELPAVIPMELPPREKETLTQTAALFLTEKES